MPATRSGVRQGSRQPGPYLQDMAGPSNLDFVHVVDDEGPPRKRQAVERKSNKQRSKQKAKAPLPPASEIIEISSDEDEPLAKKPSGSTAAFEKRINELEEENKNLKRALAAAKTAQPHPVPLAKVPTPTPDAKSDKVLSAIEEHVSCEVCTLKMWNPFTLACGHTFCKDCLQDWFSTAHMQHLTANPTYDPQRLIPLHLRAALARHDLAAPQRRHIEREIALITASTSHPQYSCPTCRVLVRAKPAENFVVKHLVRTIAAAQGESPPKEPPRALHRALEGPFDGFFPFVV
ncbi:hypothetical protein BD309DRAFT_998473 [Dichomitus squalens]|uniref:RING-type domain-containing protein n=1 Tax=Dichomitus squalens TaxID=114155 RepID=A0A4Q9QA16_9APHY|nr:hypothetical protein BD309DRAFT_998473 [Dichomitus squalens]TBU64493.1 hypothetical protein BD310DRAFT_914753 [Dichomitus squalens]